MQIDRQTDRQIDRQIDRSTVRQTDISIDRQTDIHIDGQINRWTDRQKDRQIDRYIRHPTHLLIHQWVRSAIQDSQQPTSPVGFLSLELPPPPCAVLLVIVCKHIKKVCVQIQISLLSSSRCFLNQVRGQAGRTVLMYAAECGLDDVAWLASQTVSESGCNTTACLFQCDSCEKIGHDSTNSSPRWLLQCLSPRRA